LNHNSFTPLLRSSVSAHRDTAGEPSGRVSEGSLSFLTATLLLCLKLAAGYARLPNDRLQRADPNLRMIRHRHGYCCVRKFFLHDNMTATLSDDSEPMPRKDIADFLPGKDPQLTQQQPPRALRTPRRGSVV